MKIAAALVLSLAATPALAFTPDRAAILVDAIRDMGCSMNAAQAQVALPPLQLDPIEVQTFVDNLFLEGLATISDDQDTLSLSEPLCAATGEAALALITAAFEAQEPSIEPWQPDFTAARGAEYTGAVRAAGCSLTEANAADVLVPLGFTPVESRDIASVLLDSGHALADDEGQRFSLSPEFCAADPAGDEAVIAALLADWVDDPSDIDIHFERGADQ